MHTHQQADKNNCLSNIIDPYSIHAEKKNAQKREDNAISILANTLHAMSAVYWNDYGSHSNNTSYTFFFLPQFISQREPHDVQEANESHCFRKVQHVNTFSLLGFTKLQLRRPFIRPFIHRPCKYSHRGRLSEPRNDLMS